MQKSLLQAVKYAYEYPNYTNTEVNNIIENYFGIFFDNINITNGSMEAINLLVNVLRKNKATLFKPTFLGYEDALMKYAYNINSVLLDHKLKYNVDNIELQTQNSDIIFMCNPNCHFIIDETMLIFDKKIFNKSLTKYVANVNNLSVIISFSKFLGIVGLRTGALFSNKI